MQPFFTQHLSTQIQDDELARLQRMQRACEAYHGRYPPPLKRLRDQPDDNVLINYGRIVVDKGVSFLFSKGVDFELNETTEADEWLDACWRENKKQKRLHAMALNGGIYGHTFVKIVPAMPPTTPYPRIIVLDPSTVSVDWDQHDIERAIRYTISYAAKDPSTQQIMNYRQIIEHDGDGWQIIDQQCHPDARGGDDVWITTSVIEWPYSWEPIVHCQNLPAPNEFWGVSDLESDILDLIGTISFNNSNISRILRYHAHPKTWGSGFDARDVKIAVDDIVVFPKDAELHNLEMQSDLGNSVSFIDRLREALHELARIPEVATGKFDNIGQLSGLALQILFAPLIEKTETKRSLYGELLVELNQRLLELGGFGSHNTTTLHWPELLPSDPLQERTALQMDQAFGVSNDTILTKLGYDPELEKQKKLEQSNTNGGASTQVVNTQNELDITDANGHDAVAHDDTGDAANTRASADSDTVFTSNIA